MPRKHMPPSQAGSRAAPPRKTRHGLARVISKLGVCSRANAALYIRKGRVSVNGRVVLDPEKATDVDNDSIMLDGAKIRAAARIYLMLNKPRGYVTTASDEHARQTVYALLEDAKLPWLAPV